MNENIIKEGQGPFGRRSVILLVVVFCVLLVFKLIYTDFVYFDFYYIGTLLFGTGHVGVVLMKSTFADTGRITQT